LITKRVLMRYPGNTLTRLLMPVAFIFLALIAAVSYSEEKADERKLPQLEPGQWEPLF